MRAVYYIALVFLCTVFELTTSAPDKSFEVLEKKQKDGMEKYVGRQGQGTNKQWNGEEDDDDDDNVQIQSEVNQGDGENFQEEGPQTVNDEGEVQSSQGGGGNIQSGDDEEEGECCQREDDEYEGCRHGQGKNSKTERREGERQCGGGQGGCGGRCCGGYDVGRCCGGRAEGRSSCGGRGNCGGNGGKRCGGGQG